MNKEEVYQYLKERQISFETIEHKAVYNMAEMATVDLPHPEADAKNLFLRDDKKREYYLLTVQGAKQVDLKQFQQEHGTRRLSFASDADLMKMMGLIPGAVTPLGLLNDNSCSINFYIDLVFMMEDGLVAVHPNDNTATVFLKAEDLITIIRDHGNPVFMSKF